MNQINITEITNGFLVATPGQQNPISGQMEQGKVVYFKTREEVAKALPSFFPTDLSE